MVKLENLISKILVPSFQTQSDFSSTFRNYYWEDLLKLTIETSKKKHVKDMFIVHQKNTWKKS